MKRYLKNQELKRNTKKDQDQNKNTHHRIPLT